MSGPARLIAALITVCGVQSRAAEEIALPSVLLAQATESEPEAAPETPDASDSDADAPSSDAETPPETPAAPTGSDAPPPGIEVLNVRGRTAGAIEAEVPSSVTQFDASTIQALGAQDISDLSRVTPNVNIVQPGSTQATFFVRGVGLSDFSSNAAGAVTIFQDDVAINAPAIQTGQLYDIEGVEVVRGPQGTGPFRNASAGAIRVRSRRPTGNYTSQLRSTLGWYDTAGDKGAKSALIQDYEGALEMPIVEESLSSRFAFRLRDADPYKTNGCGNAIPVDQRLPRPIFGQPADPSRTFMCGERAFPAGTVSPIAVGLPEEVNDEHNWAARGTMRFQPPDSESEFFLNAHGSRLDQDSTLGQAVGTVPLAGSDSDVRFAGSRGLAGYVDQDVLDEFTSVCGPATNGVFPCPATHPGAGDEIAKNVAERSLDKGPYRGDYNRVGQTTRDSWGGFLSGQFEAFEDTKLSLLTSYDEYERFQDNDTDFTPERLFELIQKDEAWQMYHEAQLGGELEAEPVEWNAGVYYLEEHLDNDGDLLLLQTSSTATQTRRIYSQAIRSWGIWGGFGWDFADDFTLEGGVRYNWENKEFDFRRIETGLVPIDESVTQQETWQTPTGQIILTYHIDEDKAAYARYTRGFKAGHFNALASRNIRKPPADEEYNDAWEAGLRGSWFDRRLSLAGSFFYYRYENYQVFLFLDSGDSSEFPVLEILNAKQAENFGIEIEGGVSPLKGWAPRALSGLRITGNFSWLHGEYLNFTTSRRFLIGSAVADVPIDFSGKQLQNAPEYKLSAAVEWAFDLGRYGSLIPRYDLNWSDDVFFDPNEGRGSIDPAGGPALIEYGVGQKAYFLHNVRLAYRTPSGNVELAGWVRNLEDEVYKNFAFDASRFTNIVINFPGEPRTIGMDLTFTF